MDMGNEVIRLVSGEPIKLVAIIYGEEIYRVKTEGDEQYAVLTEDSNMRFFITLQEAIGDIRNSYLCRIGF